MVMGKIKSTNTTIFMLPTLHIPRVFLVDNGFINAFMFDINSDIDYADAIYVLFKPTDMKKFKAFIESEKKRSPHLIDDYDYAPSYVVLVYRLPVKFAVDYVLVKEGKYSQTSAAFQKEFPQYITIKSTNQETLTLQYRIFNKSKDLVEYWEDLIGTNFDDSLEVWSRFNLEEEVLNIDNFKITV
jgi:hypothetical protein